MSATSRPPTRPPSAPAARRRSTAAPSRLSATRDDHVRAGREAERRALLHYRLRGYRVLDRNARAGGNELDLVLRRGRALVFCEVKSKGGDRYGDPLEMVDAEKRRRLRRAAEAWLAVRPELTELDVRFEVVGVAGRRLVRVADD